jgi:hypothetical protein
MLSLLKACALVLALTAAGAVQATQSVKVTLAEPADSPADQTGKIAVTLTNDGDEPVDILKVFTPFAQGPANGIAANIFTVKDAHGHVLPYWGVSGKYVNFTTDDFIHLLPGQSVSKTVDLGTIYEFTSGTYTVDYDVDYSMKRPDPGQTVKTAYDPAHPQATRHSQSNTLSISINASLLKHRSTA